MMLLDILNEVDISDRLAKDPQRMRMLMLALKHDRSLPIRVRAQLGPGHTEAQAAKAWSDAIETPLARTNYGDLSRDFKFADYLTKLYVSGNADFEDVTGEGGDSLGAWNALSVRGKLKPQHSDLNKFTSLHLLQQALRDDEYKRELDKIKNAERINKMKKDAKDLMLIDDPRYLVTIPLNYGACYVFNYTGHTSTFCTGSSSGEWLFDRYAGDGPIVAIVDKAHAEEKNGKWQMHAQTDQLHNSVQDSFPLPGKRDDEAFAELFPGMLRRIAAAMRAKSSEITDAGKVIQQRTRRGSGNGYDVDDTIQQMKQRFPKSWASRAKDEPADEPEPEAAPQQAAAEPAPWYGQYLHPEFRNNLPEILPGQRMRLKAIKLNQDGYRSSISGMATGLDDLLSRIRDGRPGFLAPGTLIAVEPAD